MIKIKTADEIQKMRRANRIVAQLFDYLKDYISEGVSTHQLDTIAREFIASKNARPAFLGYTTSGLPPFPNAICTSVNSCIVHGIPRKRTILKDGDILGIDVGTYLDGYYGDGAKTFKIGHVSQKAHKLMQATKYALDIAIELSRNGNRVGDISFAIGEFIKKKGYFVADNLTGHGIGSQLHEEPQIPNSGRRGVGQRLQKGMTIAIEPMVNIGTNRVRENGWECFTNDGTLSAHFEHTVLITDGKPEILTVLN